MTVVDLAPEEAGATEPAPRAAPAWLPRAGLAAVMLVALVLNGWALSRNGYGNTYYSAAARSMAESWRNFFFAALDPGGFISVDKPPVSMWFQAASVWAFGVSSWSLLLPGALAGSAAVGLLWCTVRRQFGALAAFVAALILAISPVSVAVNRLNLPEPYMILLLVAAAWAVVRSFDAKWAWPWIVAAGGLIGVAFNVKMLAALIPTPALGVAVLLGTRGTWTRRVGLAALVAVVALGVSASWTVIVDHVPGADRPYVGGSTNDTVGDLIFGYNGLNRIEGQGGGGPAGGGRFGGGGLGGPGGFAGAGGIFGGTPGATRLLSDAVGGQIAWFLPAMVVCGAAALWAERRRRERLASVVLWGGWLALYGVIFSEAKGTFHAYYTSAMAPAVAALVGIGGVALVRAATRGRHREAAVAVLAGTLLVSLWLQLVLTGRAPDFYGWLRPLIVAGVAAAVAGLALAARRSSATGRRVLGGALAVGFGALCLAPAAWAASETANAPSNATLPQAGPRGGVAASTFGSAAFDPDTALAAFLRAERGGETWDLVTANAQVASGYLAQEDLSVMALGGFMGTDNASTPAEFARQVADGEVRFVLVNRSGFGGGQPTGRRQGGPGGSGGPGGPGGAPFGGGGSATGIIALAERVCSPVTSASTNGALPPTLDGVLYDCAGRGPALVVAAA